MEVGDTAIDNIALERVLQSFITCLIWVTHIGTGPELDVMEDGAGVGVTVSVEVLEGLDAAHYHLGAKAEAHQRNGAALEEL